MEPLTNDSLLAAYPGLKFYWPAVYVAAMDHALDPYVVAACMLQESGGNADAFRHERNFWNRYLKRLPEWNTLNPRRVSSSYGLLQVMLPVAVERGYPKADPPEKLFIPEIGLEYGCRQLSWLAHKMIVAFPTSTEGERLKAVLASYNGGFQGPQTLRPDNKRYAESVLALLARLHL